MNRYTIICCALAGVAAFTWATVAASAAQPRTSTLTRKVLHERWLGDVVKAVGQLNRVEDRLAPERARSVSTFKRAMAYAELTADNLKKLQKRREVFCQRDAESAACTDTKTAVSHAHLQHSQAVKDRLVAQSELNQVTLTWALESAGALVKVLKAARELHKNVPKESKAAARRAETSIRERADKFIRQAGSLLASNQKLLKEFAKNPALAGKSRIALDAIHTARRVHAKIAALRHGKDGTYAQLLSLETTLASLAIAAYKGQQAVREYAAAMKAVNAAVLASIASHQAVMAAGGLRPFARNFTRDLGRALGANQRDMDLLMKSVNPTKPVYDDNGSIWGDADDSELLHPY